MIPQTGQPHHPGEVVTDRDAEVVEAFNLFLQSVGPPAGTRTVVKDTQAMLAALDILDPKLAERVTRKIAEANE